MSARTWWSAKADPKPAEKQDSAGGPDLPMEKLLDARIDQEGRFSRVDSESRERSSETLAARGADLGTDELDLAVQKLTEGLEAIERQSRTGRRPQRGSAPAGGRGAAPAAAEPADAAGGRDFVTYSLDRLEARLEALSRRLQQRSEGADAPPATAHAAPSLAVPEDFAAQLAESRRQAEAEEERAAEEAAEDARRAEAEDAARRRAEAAAAEERRAAELAAARREVEAAEERRRNEVAEARRQAELAEARRQAEVAEALRLAEMAEARREAEAEAAENERRRADEERRYAEEERRHAEERVEAIRLADLTEARRKTEAAEARHRAELEEAQQQAEIAAARREAELAAVLERQFGDIEDRLDALQKGLDENQVESVHAELLDLVGQITELSRGGRATKESLDAIGTRIDQMEIKLTAARNMAGNRLGDIQDRLGGLVGRLDELEAEIPGFDAIRVNQGAILERFDRMEGMVHRLASPEELFDRVEGLKRQMQTIASQREVARIEEQLLRLAERVDALPDDLSEKAVLDRIEGQLGGLATEFTEARRQRKTVATEIDRHLEELSEQIRQAAETGRTPDLSGIEGQLATLGVQVADDRQANSETLVRLEQRIAALTDAIENQEDDAATALLEDLTKKVNALGDAVESQDSAGARRDIQGLGRRLDDLSERLANEAEHLSRRQIAPIEQRLATIDERLTTLAGKAADPRALQAQIDSIVSRLELLKGRSIDPALLNDLFDRVDVAVRAMPEERFERIEQKLEEALVPAERFDRMERKIAEAAAGAAAGAAADRFAKLEKKLDEIGGSFAGGDALTQDDLADVLAEIATLRRELRSIPGLVAGDESLGSLMRSMLQRLERLPEEAPVTLADLEAQFDRLTRAIENPDHNRAGLAAIESSLKALEHRLEETQRAIAAGDGGATAGVESVAGMARALSDDVSVLRSSAETSERRTRDAIDAVQGTLEAVVKRMAFLERDVDAEAERRALGAVPVAPAVEASPPAMERAPPAESEEEAEAITELRAAEPMEEPPAGQQPASLLSRLTSRQLLRRATGGRAESFSPEPEEADDASDLPLEPGTNSPLSSALTGAPSSNTEFMSGARKGRPSESYEDRPAVPARVQLATAGDDDFLAAARRAARAAAREADEGEHRHTRSDVPVTVAASRGGARRIALIAAGIAAILVIVAVPLVRPDLIPLDRFVASAPEADPIALPAPAEEVAPIAAAPVPAMVPEAAEPPPVAEPEPPQAAAAVAPPPPAEAPRESMIAAPPVTEQSEPPAPLQAETAAPSPSEPMAPPAAAEAEMAPAPGADMAAVEPTETMEPGAAATADEIPSAETPAATVTMPAALPPLPESIGSERLREAALGGDTAAAFEVAARYAEGRGVLPDMPTAVLWYERAANLGLAPAQYRLGSIYEKGLGVPKDMEAAQGWYRRAADSGNVKAMHNLAVLHAEGAGGEPNLEEAAGLFRMAAERGVRDSQFNLAILYARGIGVPQDLVEAYKWFGIAAGSGDEESAKRRDIIGEALSERDRTRAERSIATFQPVELVPGANEVIMPEGGWSEADTSNSVEVRSDSELVALVQRLLAEGGYDPGPADGLLGRQTIDAISEFQSKAGLPPTGRIDTGLVAALQSPST